jgi:hypothetical protein
MLSSECKKIDEALKKSEKAGMRTSIERNEVLKNKKAETRVLIEQNRS